GHSATGGFLEARENREGEVPSWARASYIRGVEGRSRPGSAVLGSGPCRGIAGPPVTGCPGATLISCLFVCLLPMSFHTSRATDCSARRDSRGADSGVINKQTRRTGCASTAPGHASASVDRPTTPSTSETASLLECGTATPPPTPVDATHSRWST